MGYRTSDGEQVEREPLTTGSHHQQERWQRNGKGFSYWVREQASISIDWTSDAPSILIPAC